MGLTHLLDSSVLTRLHHAAVRDIAALTGQSCEWVVPAGSVD